MRLERQLLCSVARIWGQDSRSVSGRDSARVLPWQWATEYWPGLVLIFGGRTLSMIFVSKDSVEVLDASAKYLRCMGYFYWSLGILNVCRMVTQGLGYSGRAVFSGVTEMLARTIVSLGFVGTFGFTAICFADQTAWVTACLYIAPTCLYCIRKSTEKLK